MTSEVPPVEGSQRITDAAVESVMQDLLGDSLAVIRTLKADVQDDYVARLRAWTRSALEKAFGDA